MPNPSPDKPNSAGLRGDLRTCTWEGMVALPIVFLSLPANFIIAALLTKNFGLSAGWFGVIASLPAWSNVVQLSLLPLLTRWLNAKHLTLIAAWGTLGLLARLCPDSPVSLLRNPSSSRSLLSGFLSDFQPPSRRGRCQLDFVEPGVDF